MENATVDCLIDINTCKWDAEMLQGVLIPAEAEIVQRIPLPRSQTKDTLYWPFTVDGQYNCKSGYKFLKDLEGNSDGRTLPEVWHIWNQQNKLKTNQACYLTKDLQQRAEEIWNEIRNSNLMPDRIRSIPQTKWTSSPSSTYKINYDGAISSEGNKSVIGVVVRDCRGEVIASLVQQLDQAYQPVEVEALVACRAVEFGSELGLQRAIVKGDLELVVKALRCKDYGLAPYAYLINDVLLYSSLFSKLSYSYIRRDGNKVAHSLAKLALTSPSCTMWMEDVPYRTLSFVQADLAAL